MCYTARAGLVDAEELPEDQYNLIDKLVQSGLVAPAGAVRRNIAHRLTAGIARSVCVFVMVTLGRDSLGVGVAARAGLNRFAVLGAGRFRHSSGVSVCNFVNCKRFRLSADRTATGLFTLRCAGRCLGLLPRSEAVTSGCRNHTAFSKHYRAALTAGVAGIACFCAGGGLCVFQLGSAGVVVCIFRDRFGVGITAGLAGVLLGTG